MYVLGVMGEPCVKKLVLKREKLPGINNTPVSAPLAWAVRLQLLASDESPAEQNGENAAGMGDLYRKKIRNTVSERRDTGGAREKIQNTMGEGGGAKEKAVGRTRKGWAAVRGGPSGPCS